MKLERMLQSESGELKSDRQTSGGNSSSTSSVSDPEAGSCPSQQSQEMWPS